MKKMKRIILVFILIIFMLSANSIISNATGETFKVNLSTETATVEAGQEFQVLISFSDISTPEQFTNIDGKIYYDSDILEYVDSKAEFIGAEIISGSEIQMQSFTMNPYEDGNSIFHIEYLEGKQTKDVKIKFKVKDDAKASNTSIKLQISEATNVDDVNISGIANDASLSVNINQNNKNVTTSKQQTQSDTKQDNTEDDIKLSNEYFGIEELDENYEIEELDENYEIEEVTESNKKISGSVLSLIITIAIIAGIIFIMSIGIAVVKLVKTMKDNNYIYFLMDYIKGKELFDVIRDIGLLNKFQTQFYGASIMLAVQYLHERKFIYRDIKPENIMVLGNGYIKLIDFGTAKEIDDKTKTIIGTPHYMAPEVILGEGYSFKVDFWSIGICMYEFMCGGVPFGENHEEAMDVYLSIINE